MKKIMRLYIYDLQRGFSEAKWRLLGACLTLSAALVSTCSRSMVNSSSEPLSAASIIMGICEGNMPVVFGFDHVLVLPVTWIVVQLAVVFSIISYPVRARERDGNGIVIRTSRISWWASKCLWVFTVVSILWIVLLGFCVAVGIINGSGVFEVSYNHLLYYDDYLIINSNYSTRELILDILVCYMSSLALCMLCTALSLFVDAPYVLGGAVTYLLVSVFFENPLLFPKYGMFARSRQFDDFALCPELELAICLGVMVSAVLLGVMRVRRMQWLASYSR